MTLTTTRELVEEAVARGSGVLAFNVITLEHAEGILAGAARAGQPVVLQVSENAIRYHGAGAPLVAACTELVQAHEARAALHLDHITDPALLDVDRLAGVSSVMFDASAEEYADNVAGTRDVASRLHAAGLLVEAELGAIGGKEGAHAPGVRTDPEEARGFVADTGVDLLAVAVGSTHAMTEATAVVDEDLVRRIAAVVPVPLVLHGSSGVPRDQLRALLGAGMAKINIGTALNVAFTEQVRRVLADQPQLTDPRKYLRAARGAVAQLVEDTLLDVVG